ncbi:SWI/SNF-related matrix-associated actin-dependent regulator of chromatin subfamily A containing DEAD/H box 1 [Geosmithia morbida]|uniref:SWI/SNF-related matrix-associated actin-dependent regulator of chromatin subfamily A containing DEAD/H box 1 n=1 Tax=Geosmithia morbida TaxID=1094350 RepID=A0A9P4YTM4_9HYPO|nr:SWI/SNF-related matrix-associated actin-dependent regulator of chromatin subfamily A containing DEAD/H box 1 [Geosmithia morbida]KAF4122595.1 SWI/SNF-related matrix-associated actin-dependent regulator of chromatin subfamily A containing DEAD/H box 1 [Geosmithia morbida]
MSLPSPIPVRRLPPSPSTHRVLIDPDDIDELAGGDEDTIPCSPGAVLRHTTQPTQVPDQGNRRRSSSPTPSIIEVPASSPFQPSAQRQRRGPPNSKDNKKSSNRASLGTRLAPAGTVFRPPGMMSTVPKRPAPTEDPSVEVISDDDDDDDEGLSSFSRGKIEPTKFQTRISEFMFNPNASADKEKKTRQKLQQIFHVFGSRYPSDMVRRALRETDDDVELAMDWLERGGNRKKKAAAPASTATGNSNNGGGRRLISRASLQAKDTTPAPSPSPPPKAQPKKRRLVQGLRRQAGTPSPRKPSPSPAPPPPSSADPLVIDLVENDKDDAYEAEASPEPDGQGGSKVLDCLNTSTVSELAAMTSMKETQLEPIVQARPFADLDEAREVSAAKKPGARKTPRTSIGEAVVDAIEVFLEAVEAIDHIVSECEKKARTVGAVMDSWEVNSFGYDRRGAVDGKKGGNGGGKGGSRNDTPDLPPTPTSLSSMARLCKPPIPKQPALMDGHCTMKPFQVFGLNWMSLLHSYDIGCILADEMGLGKTCQVISLMSHLVESHDRKRKSGGGDGDGDGDGDRPWPNLIVVPPSTYNNWLAEFEKFAPDLSVVGYRGSQAERMEIAYEVAEAPERCHVVLGTYSQINSEADIESLNSMGLHAAVFDEGHKMKNPETKIYKDLRRIRTDWKMLLTGRSSPLPSSISPSLLFPLEILSFPPPSLPSSMEGGGVADTDGTRQTGTPVQNNLLEMISLLSFINPAMFDGYMEPIRYMFSTKVTIRDVSNGAFLYTERVKRARTILEPFILQRRKDQVLSEMPKKIHTQVLCDMTARQKAVYGEYERMFRMDPSERAAAAAAAGEKKSRSASRQNDQNNVWMQLRKAAIHPILFRRHFTDARCEEMARMLMERIPQSELHQPNLGHLVQELRNSSDFDLHLWCRDYGPLLGRFDYEPGTEMDSGKVRKLVELVTAYRSRGDRVLVFSRFSRVIELLREVMALHGVDHRVLVGNTNVAERQEMIDDFNADASIPVFLLTTGAGGTGINLTSANKVVIFDQSDNPQDDIQAENRAHRLGQKRDVEVIRLLSRGTVEELIDKACQKKIELADRVTGGGGGGGDEGDDVNIENEVRSMMKDMTPP